VHTDLGEQGIYDPIGLAEKRVKQVLRLYILVVPMFCTGLRSEDRLLAALSEVIDVHGFQVLNEILRTIYNTIRGLPMPDNLSRIDSNTSVGVGWVIAQGILFGIFLLALIAGETVSDVPGLLFAQIVGLIVAVAGSVLSVWSLMQHGWQVSPFPRPVDGAVLVETGPYRYVRHPMYSGIVVFTLGVGLAYANPVAILSSITFLVFFMAKTGREEEMLVEQVDGYRSYRSDVPWRLIPFVM
jgi:protein-S-isoprenylcysteine O-methyltransferase Ste14